MNYIKGVAKWLRPFLLENDMKEFKGLELWDKVQMTNPAHTKDSSFGRKITTIDAYQQIKNVTEVFGTCGVGWGFDSKIISAPHTACVVQLTIWIKDHGTFTDFGTCDWYQRSKKNPEGNFDLDAPKKATTDGLTKAFSRMGFNADIFLGMFEDNRYVQHATEESNKKEDAKHDEKAKKESADRDSKNLKAIMARLGKDDVKDAESLKDVYTKLDAHFGPLYGCEVGKFFNNPYFQAPIVEKCIELNVNPVEVHNG